MTPWLSIVGIGEDGLAGLTPAAAALVNTAEVLIGGERHLAMVPEDGRERLAWPSPLQELMPEIERRRGRRVCVIATGNPLWYGVGTTLMRHFPVAETTMVPAPSSFSLACARLGWSLADVETLTLHGRPLELLHPYVQPGARLLMLSEDGATPAKVARLLRERDYGESEITLLEHIGGPDEQSETATADRWTLNQTADLNMLAVACVAGANAAHLPRVPGLPDEAYRHDGQLTKREVRAVTLAALGPAPHQMLWDVGAGAGSIAIERSRAAPWARAVAVERQAKRRSLIADNAAALGAPLLTVVPGEAPAALEGLPPPDAIFVGGGVSAGGLLEACWDRLGPGGRLVSNAVTLEGEQALVAWQRQNGGALTRLEVSRAEPVGALTGWRALMPVTQLAAVKR